MKTTEDKYQIIIDNNTFYFYNPLFEEKNESYINTVKETLLVLKNEIGEGTIDKTKLSNFLKDKPYGLRALLALTGISKEFLFRLITIIRAVDDPELSALTYRADWCGQIDENLSEWKENKIQRLIRQNDKFRLGIVNIFFEGATIPFLAQTIPLFELKKFSITKLNFDFNSIIDTLIRYREKGSYSGNAENNAEAVIATIIKEIGLTFEKGDLSDLVTNAPNQKRTMDFIIPNKREPKIIVESSFLSTTSSGMGDKAKTEIGVAALIKTHYPQSQFIGFIDGVGWYVRRTDLKRMVHAFDDVFTFHHTELKRFERLLIDVCGYGNIFK